jgi:hypothetical protein
MKLQCKQLALTIFNRCVRRVFRGCDRFESPGNFCQPVSMRVPDLQFLGQVGEQWAEAVLYAQGSFAEFALQSLLHLASQVITHQLQAVADPQHGNSEFKNGGIGARGFRIEHAGRPSGQNDPLGRKTGDLLRGDVVPHDDRVHVAFTDPASDHLRVLRPKIQYNNLLHRFFLKQKGSVSSCPLNFDGSEGVFASKVLVVALAA